MIIMDSDPLFGVLEDHQIVVNPNTGRPRIAKEVVEGMRQYLLVADDEMERLTRAERIKSSLAVLKNDPIGEKTILRLEPAPLVSININIGKSIIFDYAKQAVSEAIVKEDQFRTKLMGAIKAGQSMALDGAQIQAMSDGIYMFQPEESSSSYQVSSTVIRTRIFEAGSSGTSMKKFKGRRRPTRGKRQGKDGKNFAKAEDTKEKKEEVLLKRKAADEATTSSKVARHKSKEVAPVEGPFTA
ncbi:hypothetical protein V5N11_008544 [Cardamine amara subsp. amara]|uniref:Uncharacterized protein n=1 Tax=Cardamine amara subsp. amara TaxID=228776 RepID=A0ABD0ZWF9_CARAN